MTSQNDRRKENNLVGAIVRFYILSVVVAGDRFLVLRRKISYESDGTGQEDSELLVSPQISVSLIYPSNCVSYKSTLSDTGFAMSVGLKMAKSVDV